MRQEAKSRRQHHNVDAPQPTILEHLPDLVEEDARFRLGGFISIKFRLALSLSAEEEFTFGKERSQYCSES